MTPKDPIHVHTTVFPAPFGCLWAAATDAGLLALEIEQARPTDPARLAHWIQALAPSLKMRVEHRLSAALARLDSILQDYFSRGEPIPPVPLDLRLGTDFQQEVWRALIRIPHGETRSYGQIADRIGRPRAFRAVGQACGRNPIPIIVPCHRVITSTGGLGGFGSGLDIKRYLLRLEQRQPVRS